MSGYEVCAAVLMLGALLPSLIRAATGRSADRLIGLVLASSVITVIMLLMGQISESYDLIVPLVLVVLSVVGTLVFTRLISGVQDGP